MGEITQIQERSLLDTQGYLVTNGDQTTRVETETVQRPVQTFKAVNEERILCQRQRQQTWTATPGLYPVKMRCPLCHKMITTRIAQNKSILQRISGAMCFPFYHLDCSKPMKVFHSCPDCEIYLGFYNGGRDGC